MLQGHSHGLIFESMALSLALRLALTRVLNSCFTGSFPAQNPCPVPSGAGVPAHQGTGARPTVRYSTSQPQVPLYPHCTWFQCSIPQNRDSDSSEQRQCIYISLSVISMGHLPRLHGFTMKTARLGMVAVTCTQQLGLLVRGHLPWVSISSYGSHHLFCVLL